MKILFWNIGKVLSPKKRNLIVEAISSETPDIFCIAEGSYSTKDCQTMISIFDANHYYCYYSPLFYLDESLKLNNKYNRNGLKIFIKDRSILLEKFFFENQRQDGRIVFLKALINSRLTTIVFLHNFSKSGNREVTDDQRNFIGSLSDMIEIGKISRNTERTLIIGDFNIEPWDNILRHKKYFETSFIDKHNLINLRKTNSTNQYFNPIAELIFRSKVENLGGTYFSDKNGWALFDFCLFDTKTLDLQYEIMTEFKGKSKLLNFDIKINGNFINDGLDHLPILTQINN